MPCHRAGETNPALLLRRFWSGIFPILPIHNPIPEMRCLACQSLNTDQEIHSALFRVSMRLHFNALGELYFDKFVKLLFEFM